MENQGDIFLSGEGDEWFSRNSAKLVNSNSKQIDLLEIESVLNPFKNDINRILEIGCSNALKLEFLAKKFEAVGSGVDPSLMAINDAKHRHSKLLGSLKVGLAERLDFASDEFDVVVFGFCLYLQDRSSLLSAFNEADRVLRKGGFLVVTDFDPGTPKDNQYIHRSGVKSFKQDYAKYFIDELGYYLVSKRSFSHRLNGFDINPDERVSTQILFK